MTDINNILNSIKIEIDKLEVVMEGADSVNFLFCEGKVSMLHGLAQEINVISLNQGRTLDEYLPVLRARQDAIYTVIDLIKGREVVE